MARTQTGSDLTRLHREAQIGLAEEARKRVAASWPLLDPRDLDATFDSWLEVAMPAVLDGRERSAATASTYYRAFARVESGRDLVIAPPATRDADLRAIETSLRVQGPVTIKSLSGSGFEVSSAARSALTSVLGSAGRHVLDGGRHSLVDAIRTDPEAHGWRRIGSGACGFCRMLIGRGEVYSPERARFAAHDKCQCSAEPSFEPGEPLKVEQYTASKRYDHLSEEAAKAARKRDAVRVRSFLSGHPEI